MWYIKKTNICSSYAERGNAVEVRISSQMSWTNSRYWEKQRSMMCPVVPAVHPERMTDRESAIRWRLACATALHLTAGACLF